MAAIVDAGLDDYYRRRIGPAESGFVPEDIQASLDGFAVYDEPETTARHVVEVDAQGMPAPAGNAVAAEVLLSVEGLRCGACVWLVERRLRALPGIVAASLNFSTARARVRYDASQVSLSSVLARIASVGYRARPFDARERESRLKAESRSKLQRLFVAGIATTQVMMYALPAYLAGAEELHPTHERLLDWASLVLTTPVMLYSARPFFSRAWRDLLARQAGMDLPVSIALVAAFVVSLQAIVTGQGEVWFDSIAMFVFLLLGARWLEWQARLRALRAIDDIGAAAPEMAMKLERADPDAGWQAVRVPTLRLAPGDRVRVSSGERVPVDGRLIGKSAALDLSLISGESLPETIAEGFSVPGGAINAGAPLELLVEKAASGSALSMIERLMERGAEEKPALVCIADRVGAVFVGMLLLFATGVFIVWLWVDPSRAALVALTTLVVSCPCALSLATPAALAAASGRLLRRRVLITRGHAIETLAKVTDVVFDKTGTLTRGQPVLAGMTLAENVSRQEALGLAAGLEAGTAHPFGKALLTTAHAEGVAVADVIDRELASGSGVAGCRGDGVELRLGSANWCELDDVLAARWRRGALPEASGSAHEGFHAPSHHRVSASEVFLVSRDQSAKTGCDTSPFVPLARFTFVDPLRIESLDVVASLEAQGMRVHLLSGDRSTTVEAFASALRIDSASGSATPIDKQRFVADLQASDKVVLMVGDGINDAPVLALADISLAIGDASDLARTAADVVSLAPGLDVLLPLLDSSRRCVRIIHQNLAWAALYNATAIPAAALGWVSPWAAALGMAGSSLLVVGNALRLSRS